MERESVAAILCAMSIGGCCFLLSAPTAAFGSEQSKPPAPLATRSPVVEGLAIPFAPENASYEELKNRQDVTISAIALDDVSVDLELQQFDVFADGAVVVTGTSDGDTHAERPEVALFKGQVRGDPGSRVFLSVSPFGVHGTIDSKGETWVVSSGGHESNLQPVIYNLNELPCEAIDWTPFQCGVVEAPGVAPLRNVSTGAPRDAPLTRCRLVRVAVDSDWEFTGSLYGGDVNASGAYAATLIGAVSQIYWRDFRVELEISYLRMWSDGADPWDQPDTISQITQFRDHWQGMGEIDRNIAHFLSGRPLGGGVAYGGVLCSDAWGFGLSADLGGGFPYPLQDNHRNNWDPYVVAHEIGHNFAAPHTHELTPPADGCGLGDCTDADLGTIMSYCHGCPGGMNNIRLKFHSRTINETVAPYLTAVDDCLTDAGSEFTVQPQPSQTVCPGNMVLLTVATDATIPTYQWRKGETDLVEGPNLIGANGPSLVIVSASGDDSANDYNCVVTDLLSECGGVSDFAEVIVDPYDATITQQPLAQTVSENEPLVLSIGVEDAVLFTYRWRKDATPLVDDGRIYGAESTSLILASTQLSDAGSYDCEVSGALGAHCAVLSDPAMVVIEPVSQCPGDLDSDGDVDLVDLSTLLANYGVANGATPEDGDTDDDGDVDLADLSVLLADYGRVDC